MITFPFIESFLQMLCFPALWCFFTDDEPNFLGLIFALLVIWGIYFVEPTILSMAGAGALAFLFIVSTLKFFDE